MMRKQKHYLYLNSEETRLVLQSLIRLKNCLIQEGRYTDCVDELIVKVTSAPVKEWKFNIRCYIHRPFILLKSRRPFFISVHSRRVAASVVAFASV